MKRLILSSLVLLAAITACKKDTPLSEEIIGKWNVISFSQVTYANNVKKNETTYYLDTNELAIQFAAGGTGIYYQNNDVYGTFSWTLSGSSVTIAGNTPVIWDISINKNQLVWTFSETETTDTVNYKYQYFYTANKSGK
ncbi:MAG: hypothetical protein ABSA76_14295 [Bacteroidales bacterium]